MSYTVYVLRSIKDGKYYIGHTRDLPDRVRRHNENRVSVTKKRGPWRVVLEEFFDTRSEAMMREIAIKRQKNRSYIDSIIAG